MALYLSSGFRDHLRSPRPTPVTASLQPLPSIVGHHHGSDCILDVQAVLQERLIVQREGVDGPTCWARRRSSDTSSRGGAGHRHLRRQAQRFDPRQACRHLDVQLRRGSLSRQLDAAVGLGVRGVFLLQLTASLLVPPGTGECAKGQPAEEEEVGGGHPMPCHHPELFLRLPGRQDDASHDLGGDLVPRCAGRHRRSIAIPYPPLTCGVSFILVGAS